MSKFNAGDIVYLSEQGVDEFSRNYWEDFHLPQAIYNGSKAVVEYVTDVTRTGKTEVHVNVEDKGCCFFYEEHLSLIKSENKKEPEYTGGSSNYYKVFIKNPTTLEKSYEAECNDIIEALQMTFAEGNAFKAIWRKAKARQGVQKKGYDNGLYDSEKVVFFGERMVVEAKEKGNEPK